MGVMNAASAGKHGAASSWTADEAPHRVRLNREERRVLSFLREQVPELATPFVSFVPEGRRAILNRLATSLLWEDVAGLASDSYELEIYGPEAVASTAAVEVDRHNVVDSLREFSQASDVTCKVVPL